jgi:cysteine desulfurase
MRRVNFDYYAAKPVPDVVLQAIMPYFQTHFGNPSSIHSSGEGPLEAIGRARQQVAKLINAEAPEEIYFTSCGTESNNWAIKGTVWKNRTKGRHVIISSVEHFSVYYVANTLERWGYEVTRVPVDEYGRVDPDEVRRMIRKDTILVSIMHSTPEVGTLQPIKEIGAITREAGVVFHTDAVGSVGMVPVNVQELGVDLLSCASDQLYGPKGVGVLYMKKGTPTQRLLDGGGQEDGRRSGTENVPAIVGMGAAAEIALREMDRYTAHYKDLEQRLRAGLSERIDNLHWTGHPTERLPGYLSVSVEYVEGEAMLLFMDSEGISVASGSACTSVSLKASHVLAAMGIPPDLAQGSLLFSLGRESTPEDVDYVLEQFPPIVERLRRMSPLYQKRAH